MDKHTKLDEANEAKRRASALVSFIDLLDEPVDPETIQRAALAPLSPRAVQAAFGQSVRIAGAPRGESSRDVDGIVPPHAPDGRRTVSPTPCSV